VLLEDGQALTRAAISDQTSIQPAGAAATMHSGQAGSGTAVALLRGRSVLFQGHTVMTAEGAAVIGMHHTPGPGEALSFYDVRGAAASRGSRQEGADRKCNLDG